VRSGRMYLIGTGNDYIDVWTTYHVYSRHFTIVFNTFVMMQMFNFLNSRKLNDEVVFKVIQLNIFAGITNNWLFLAIVAAIISLQILLITFGSIAFGVYAYYGLTIQQWLISVLTRSI
jgi:Ca2+ transporting ATPase